MYEVLLAKIFTLLLIFFLISSNAFANKITINLSSGLPAAGIVVYLTAKQNTAEIKAAKKLFHQSPTTISQHQKKFAPYFTVVTTNTDVTFDNLDDITHHIYSVNADSQFDFKLRKGSTEKSLSFNKQQSISMGCNIHDWMAGHLLVLDTPFYGITDEKGRLKFTALPKGNYILSLYHPQLKQTDLEDKHEIQLPLNQTYKLTLQRQMAETPPQQSLDDFDFVENY